MKFRYNPEKSVDKMIAENAVDALPQLSDDEIPEDVLTDARAMLEAEEQKEIERYVQCYSEAYEDALKDIAIGWGVDGVIQNGPATIILWKDHTKTMAICDPDDKYNMSAGIAICMAKKAFGNAGFRQILEAYDKDVK